jgi:hypothetical protein
MPKKRQGLLLTLGGAPASPHVVSPLPGYYRPDVAHLVGEAGDDLTLDEAKAAVKNHSDILELVDVSAADVERAEAVATQDLAAGRNALGDARRDGRTEDSRSRAKDEATALKEGS